jgi:hypothetical protein
MGLPHERNIFAIGLTANVMHFQLSNTISLIYNAKSYLTQIDGFCGFLGWFTVEG